MSFLAGFRVAIAGTAFLIAATLGLVVAAAAPADTTDRWVDVQTGDDQSGDNDCSDPLLPCATISQALEKSTGPDLVNIDEGTYFENLEVTNGQTLRHLDFVEGDAGIVIVDGGAGRAINVTETPGAEIIGLVIRGNEAGVAASVTVTVRENVFDDPDADNMSAVELRAGADGSVVTSNELVDPDPSITRSRTGVYSVAAGVEISGNTIRGMNTGIDTRSFTGTEGPLIRDNDIKGTHHLPIAGRGIWAGANARVVRNRITDPMNENTSGIHAASDIVTDGNFISGHTRAIPVSAGNTVSLNNDVLVRNRYGVDVSDSAGDEHAKVSISNLTVWDSGVHGLGLAGEMIIDSSIFDSVTSYPGISFCSVTYSLGDLKFPVGYGCDDFGAIDDPMFVDPDNDDFSLRPDSPLIDAGNPAAPPGDGLAFNDVPRALPGHLLCDVEIPARRDIGAYEFVPPLADCNPPNTKFQKKPKKKVKSKKVTFKLASTEPGSTFECKLDKKKWKACAATVKVSVKPGKHTFRARAVDEAGNRDKSPAKFKFQRVKKKKK